MRWAFIGLVVWVGVAGTLMGGGLFGFALIAFFWFPWYAGAIAYAVAADVIANKSNQRFWRTLAFAAAGLGFLYACPYLGLVKANASGLFWFIALPPSACLAVLYLVKNSMSAKDQPVEPMQQDVGSSPALNLPDTTSF
jgi:hypothetical protein